MPYGSYLNNMKVHKHKFLISIPNEVIALLSDCSIRVFVCWNFSNENFLTHNDFDFPNTV